MEKHCNTQCLVNVPFYIFLYKLLELHLVYILTVADVTLNDLTAQRCIKFQNT